MVCDGVVLQGAISSVFQSHLKVGSFKCISVSFFDSREALSGVGGAGAEKQHIAGAKGDGVRMTCDQCHFQPAAACFHYVTRCVQEETWEGVDMGDGLAVFSSAQAVFGAVKKM